MTREGNDVAVLFYGSVVDYGADWCLAQPGVARLDLGAFAVGTYTFDVTLWHNDNGNGVPEELPLGDVSMVVAATPAFPAPALGTYAKFLAVALLTLIAYASLHRRPREKLARI